MDIRINNWSYGKVSIVVVVGDCCHCPHPPYHHHCHQYCYRHWHHGRSHHHHHPRHHKKLMFCAFPHHQSELRLRTNTQMSVFEFVYAGQLTLSTHLMNPDLCFVRNSPKPDLCYVFGFRITNSPIADVFIIWANCEDKRIRGFILEKVCCNSIKYKNVWFDVQSCTNCSVNLEYVPGEGGGGYSIKFYMWRLRPEVLTL